MPWLSGLILLGVFPALLSESPLLRPVTAHPAAPLPANDQPANDQPANVEPSAGGPEASDSSARRKTITLVIDYGDGFQKRFNAIAWHDRMTVLDGMQVARRHPRARFDFKSQGAGATALLLEIDDVANEGGGQRNWIYRVNRVKGDRSFGIRELDAGDEVLWRFERYL